MSQQKNVTRRTNDAGMGYFDISYRGTRSRIYTGKPVTEATDAWFRAREILLAEMVASGTFEIEKAKQMIGVEPQRQKRTTPPKVRVTVASFGEEWLAHKQTVISGAKVQEYRDALALVCATEVGQTKRFPFGTIALRDLRNEHVDWLTNMLSQRKGLKSPTLSSTRLNDIMMKVVRPLLRLAYEREYLPRNPQTWIHKKPEERPDDIDPFSVEEMLLFLAALPDPTWVRFYTVAFGTGLRPSEQYALTWTHVDFPGKVLLIRQGFVKDRLTTLKTKGSRRNVTMLPHVEEALRQHAHVTQQTGQYVFTNTTGGPLHRDNVRNRIWNPTLKRAGLRHRTPYQTRHTFASLMLYYQEDMTWIARMMGHTSLRMLQERYAKFIQQRRHNDGEAFTTALTAAQAKPSLVRP